MSGPTYCDMCGRWPATRYNNGTRCCTCDDIRWAKHHPVPLPKDPAMCKDLERLAKGGKETA